MSIPHTAMDVLAATLFVQTAGQIGLVTKTYITGAVQVHVQGRSWVFNPHCLLPAPGETASYTPDHQSMSP